MSFKIATVIVDGDDNFSPSAVRALVSLEMSKPSPHRVADPYGIPTLNVSIYRFVDGIDTCFHFVCNGSFGRFGLDVQSEDITDLEHERLNSAIAKKLREVL